MKFKLPQMLGGIAAIAFIFTNFLYLVNWFVAEYGDPGTEFKFWIWPFTALIQIAALLMFTLLFNNKVIRYIAVGVFLFMRLIHSLAWMNFPDYDGGIFNSAKVFFGWLYEARTALENIATLTGILSFIIFVVAVVMSFINLPQTTTPARPNTEGEAA
jgi:hypothetical protein